MIGHHTTSAASKKMRSVYFIQHRCGGPIKIGSADKPLHRVAALRKQYGADLQIITCVPGRRIDEFTLHRIFAADRIVDEWFEPSLHLTAFIKMVEALGAIPAPYQWEASCGNQYSPRPFRPHIPRPSKEVARMALSTALNGATQ